MLLMSDPSPGTVNSCCRSCRHTRNQLHALLQVNTQPAQAILQLPCSSSSSIAPGEHPLRPAQVSRKPLLRLAGQACTRPARISCKQMPGPLVLIYSMQCTHLLQHQEHGHVPAAQARKVGHEPVVERLQDNEAAAAARESRPHYHAYACSDAVAHANRYDTRYVHACSPVERRNTK